ncbi:MAG: cupin-like domain-containing protein [Rhodanobacter sp.]
MNVSTTTPIDVDWSRFDPWRIQAVRHRLADHPLLQSDQLVALSERFRCSSRLFTFSNKAGAAANFDEVSRLYPNARTIKDSLQDISGAKAWVLLRHVQADPAYRVLIDDALNPIQPEIERKDPGMYYRAGWIFVAAPHTTTPFHIDRNHGILLQVRGVKTVYVWDAEDAEVVTDRARDVFHARHDLDLVKWNEEFRERAHVFKVGPGMGVYIPETCAHMVETSDEPSTTISLTYSTKATRRDALVHVMHDLMHRKGIEPPAVGKRPMLDRLTYAAGSALVAVHGVGGRPPACPSLGRHSAYAVAD